MRTRHLNPDHVTSFKFFERHEHPLYEWRKGRTILGIPYLKEGFHMGFSGDFVSNETILKNKGLNIVGNNVYYKPHIEYSMANGKHYYKFFETEEEALSYILVKNRVSIEIVEND